MKKGNLSVIEFESESRISQIITFIENKPTPNISDVILINLLENGFESETSILTPENRIQMWFKFSKNLPNFHWEKCEELTELNGIKKSAQRCSTKTSHSSNESVSSKTVSRSRAVNLPR